MTEPVEPKPSDARKTKPCKHLRKQLIAKDEDAEYWECFDCGEIFEPGEDGGVVNIDGSLSDA
jgi:hypothetical protein